MRDPRIEPREGDVLRQGNRAVMVHFVRGGEVFFGATDGERSSLGGGRMPLEAFREAARGVEADAWEGGADLV
jgi:hypothetical protein